MAKKLMVLGSGFKMARERLGDGANGRKSDGSTGSTGSTSAHQPAHHK